MLKMYCDFCGKEIPTPREAPTLPANFGNVMSAAGIEWKVDACSACISRVEQTNWRQIIKAEICGVKPG